MTTAKWLLVAAVALLAGWGGVEFGRKMHPSEVTPPATQGVDAVAQLMATALTTPDGKAKKLADWQGKLLVINFWATWCPPCREEMPEFSRAQDQYGANGVQFVGIAIDEADKVIEFSKKTPVVYPLLVGPSELQSLMTKLGNQQGGLPFTVIIGRDGKLKSSHLGQLSKDELRNLLSPLL